MMTRKRRLGTTELEITAVGFGAWAIGGAVGHTVGDRNAEIVEAIRRCRAASGPLAPAESEAA